ncbi:ABC transporter ATP-binding protein [Rhodovulum sulfidophilum]|uniref:ABC transporter ATP-binding protein n=2 Tax=Rhodovulum visakhapatnamense TaxID=364297 RepID=A0ABS1RE15_9RHOB|nr:ABC transporter ATP-binding protein [Rhodovulum visakhapatnamense]MBL3569649.1 ABC transporter ATP-binding protein [Rhodovulum visakhapatnamense]MBL3577881.1 ABC transporter ATP-binding protein [Rhodovulum visakhapatnamense]OLS43686.1 ABC transporter ATP-binding protein [Rhodovulum sulfidophilum]
MIQVCLLSKRFGAAEVLGRIELEVAAGETVALLGPSGIGKSTLLRIVAGLDPDFEGRVQCPERIAMVFQEPTLLPWRTALQNLRLVHPGLGRADAQDMLARVGLTDKGRAYPAQLSLGQQRRLALARAFAGRPQALVLDEPFASLDPETAEAMLALTERLIAEARPATLLVTHARAEAERLASRIHVLVGQPAVLREGA